GGGVFAQSVEKLDSANSRHFKVQQNQLWQRLVTVGKPAFAKNEIERFNSVREAQYFLGCANTTQCPHRQFGIRKIVLNQEDLDLVPFIQGLARMPESRTFLHLGVAAKLPQ
ncbi:MAG TPA: hypothetical protein VN891_13390, partial [Steroidobacteraceae bacterium]|nr:hypothetical protein [Steroidobacteraceae bacterium]